MLGNISNTRISILFPACPVTGHRSDRTNGKLVLTITAFRYIHHTVVMEVDVFSDLNFQTVLYVVRALYQTWYDFFLRYVIFIQPNKASKLSTSVTDQEGLFGQESHIFG